MYLQVNDLPNQSGDFNGIAFNIKSSKVVFPDSNQVYNLKNWPELFREKLRTSKSFGVDKKVFQLIVVFVIDK